MTSLPIAPSLPDTRVRPALAVTLGALVTLTKPQLAFMTVLTAMVAFGTTRPAAGLVLATLAGTVFAAAGALSLNQWWERKADTLMRRTRGRPLPQALLTPACALVWSASLAAAGVGVLAVWVNAPAAAIAALTILVYGLIYTPLKRRTRWATEIGAISGALPPLLGNAAAGDVWAPAGVTLAAILFCWQMPHFFAIGWRHRDDYRAAGFRVLPAVDPTGRRTAAWSLFYAALLVPVAVAPWALGCLGALYGAPALLAGLAFLWSAWRFAAASGTRDCEARHLFLASILHLPIVLGALLLERLAAG